MAGRDDERGQAEGRRPSDTEALVGDTAASERLTDAERVQPPERDEREVRVAAPADAGAGRAAPRVPTDDDAEREAELGHS